jgi:TonB-linked SusC/RagA family outer membrane protein
MGSLRSVTILLLVSIQSLPALSQNGMVVSLAVKDASLDDVLERIHEQTGFSYFGEARWKETAHKVTVDAAEMPLRVVLEMIFRDQPLSFELFSHSISIKTLSRDQYIHGRVMNDKNEPIPGASILVKEVHAYLAGTSNESGEFLIKGMQAGAVLIFSCIDYETREIRAEPGKDLTVKMPVKITELSAATVPVMHTGYQEVEKGRETGSYFHLDQELIGRRVSPNILDRLDGVTGSLLFDKNVSTTSNASSMTIRGRSTIFGNPSPLIVVDNFPIAGDSTNININPDDVESITVLKDAAAASIWGAFSGNGVVVITTRKGKFNQGPRLNFNTSFTIGEKPDLYYQPILSSADYIDVERFLFSNGFYDNAVTNPAHPALTPGVEIMYREAEGDISAAREDRMLDSMSQLDARRDLDKYFYRRSMNQQYSLNLSGGGRKNTYYISTGFDKDLSNMAGNQYDRVTMNGNTSYAVVPEKLQISAGFAFMASRTYNNNPGYLTLRYPYARLADEYGNALPVTYQYRQSYIDTAGVVNGAHTLLDWNYRPLDQLRDADDVTNIVDCRLSFGMQYTIRKGLDLHGYFQYSHRRSDLQDFQSQQLYSTRDLINQFTQVDLAGKYSYPVPLGGILDETQYNYGAGNARLQLNFCHLLGKEGSLTAIGGAEVRDVEGQASFNRQFGYNRSMETGAPVNTNTYFNNYVTGNPAMIPDPHSNIGSSSRFLSIYFTGSYEYKRRYIVSGSARRDESNLFGVKANQRGVPLWSAGLGWEASRENFYRVNWLPLLKLRITDGYNGNVDNMVFAYTTAVVNPLANFYGNQTSTISNPPNPSLRWERVNILNLGLDFAVRKNVFDGKNVLDGSIEYFMKAGKDLTGLSRLDPTTGNVQFTGNTAGMKVHGWDITLHTRQSLERVRWNSVLLFSLAKDEVTDYKFSPGAIFSYLNQSFLNPVVARPLYSLYAYRWMGLDNQGNPEGSLRGRASLNYDSIGNSTDLNNLLYKGPANPTIFGSWRNGFSWRSWEFSFNVVYKFGYYFRRSSIHYFNLFNGSNPGHPDYKRRWQRAGDEKKTFVPSMVMESSPSRDDFYANSDVLVEKGDHIRLQDIQISYDLFPDKLPKWSLKSLRLYVYANNIGIIWRANSYGIDPDQVNGVPNPRTLALGVKAGF